MLEVAGRWTPVDLDLRMGRKLRASASELEDTDFPDCALRQALKMRTDTKVVTPGWHRGWQDKFPLGWFIEALPVLHRRLAAGDTADAALAAAQLTYAVAHPGLRTFYDHAIAEYVDFHQCREALVGPLRYMHHEAEVVLDAKAGSSLYVWAPVFEGNNGYREIRRLRVRRVQREVTAWAAIAAKVVAEMNGVTASRVSVVEFSLADGQDAVLLNTITSAEADALYVDLGRPRARKVMNGLIPTPCSKCSDCKAVAACRQPIQMRGVLRQSQRGIYTRSVSASDLATYCRCPARWYMAKECHLPLDEVDSVGVDARIRGSAVHRWLKESHNRGVACTDADLPDAMDWGDDDIGGDSLSIEEYVGALPYLRQHVGQCAVGDGDLLAVDEPFYGWDSSADVVVAGMPDLVRQSGDRLVVRELKTTANALPETAAIARDQFDGVVYWWLSMLTGGWLAHFGCDEGIVELEVVGPTSAMTFSYSTEDEDMTDMAETRMDSRVSSWHFDASWPTKPGPDCPSCPVRAWCPDRDVFLDRVVAAQDEASF